MKLYTLLIFTIAAILLLGGCGQEDFPVIGTSVDIEAAYAQVFSDWQLWSVEENLVYYINGSISAAHGDSASFSAFSGFYQQRVRDQAKEIYTQLSLSLSDGDYYDYRYATDSLRYIGYVESGDLNITSSDDERNKTYNCEELQQSDFNECITYGKPVWPFEESMVKAATEDFDEESGDKTLLLYFHPEQSEQTVVILLEAINYLDTSNNDIECETQSIFLQADYHEDALRSLSYNVSAKLSSQGETLNVVYKIYYSLAATGENVSFELPDFDQMLSSGE